MNRVEPTVLILGGTREARALAERLHDAGVPVVSSLAGRVSNPALPVGGVRVGGFGGVAGLAGYLAGQPIAAVVDATHPFAATISAHAVEASTTAGIPLLRLVRPGWADHPHAVSWTWVDTISDACRAMQQLGDRPFLTTGRQGLEHFAAWRDHWALVRLVEPPEDAWPNWTILQARGPFDVAAERTLMAEHRIDVLVSKDSGGALTEAKLDVAAELGLGVVMVARPPEAAPPDQRVSTVEAAVRWVLTHRPPGETVGAARTAVGRTGTGLSPSGLSPSGLSPSGPPPSGPPPSGSPASASAVSDGSVGPPAPRSDWQRAVPRVGDTSAATERAADPRGWAFDQAEIAALDRILRARRDIRRFRPDPVPDKVLTAILGAGHAGPSVGHSQPWRFIVVTDPAIRDRAAHLADRMRLEQAAGLTSDRAQRLLDLKLEGLREAPIGVVVACDRRTPAAGVLGRATFPDTDLWSCACAIENMWLTARAHGVGMGWVTLFDPAELAELLHLPEGVETLGWLCLGWPDERPPEPGLQRNAWSAKLPLTDVVLSDRWPAAQAPAEPVSHLRAPSPERLVAATDDADRLLTPPESLGVLDRAINRIAATGPLPSGGTLVLAGADHPVAELGVSAFPASTTAEVLAAAAQGESLGVATAMTAGLKVVVVDAGVTGGPFCGAVVAHPQDPRGNLRDTDALSAADVARLLAAGRRLGAELGGLVVLGEVGIGNTTVAAALTCALTGLNAADAVGLGAGSDAGILETKRMVVQAALDRVGPGIATDPLRMLAALGGAELTFLTGVVLGAAATGTPVVLDGLATAVAALVATRIEPGTQAYLIAGQASREQAQAVVLRHLGLEPLLQLRLRAGEGVGGCLAASLVLQAIQARARTGRTSR